MLSRSADSSGTNRAGGGTFHRPPRGAQTPPSALMRQIHARCYAASEPRATHHPARARTQTAPAPLSPPPRVPLPAIPNHPEPVPAGPLHRAPDVLLQSPVTYAQEQVRLHHPPCPSPHARAAPTPLQVPGAPTHVAHLLIPQRNGRVWGSEPPIGRRVLP